MQPIYLFNLASQHNRWLSVRQAAIAGNIANANTPGFKAQDVAPFETVLDATQLTMTATQPGHITPAPANVPAPEVRVHKPWEVMHSGNSVSLEQELLKAGEVNRAYALDTSMVKAFHRMLLTSVKG